VKNAGVIAWRELRAYFTSWMAYVVMAGFLAISGFIFYVILVESREAQMRWAFHNMTITLLFVGPLLTMRLVAEEKRSGTFELLMTSPVTEAQVVVGKFLAALGLLAFMLILTFEFPIVLMRYGEPDIGPLLCGYVGFLLAGACFVAVGVLASAVADSQVVAGFMGFGLSLLFWIIGWAANQAGPKVAEVLRYLSFLTHFEDFGRGVIDTKSVIFYLSIIVFCLFAAMRVLESRRWR
jgi:ABC-2 type transport system permease protein